MTELKPCPFCGGEAELIDKYEGVFWIICKGCLCESGFVKTKEEAINAWNRRADDDR